jgi:hypothetical protein
LAAVALSFVLVGKLDLIQLSSSKLNYLDLARKILGLPLLSIALFYFASLSVSTLSQGLLKGFDRPETNMEKVIYALVPKDGSYGNSSINVYEYVSTDRLPANGITGLVPWMVQDRENIFIDEIKKSPPELIFYNPLNEVWGYKLIDYAPLIHIFVEENYKKVPVSPELFEGQFVYLKSSSYSKNLSKLKKSIKTFCYQKRIQINLIFNKKLIKKPNIVINIISSISLVLLLGISGYMAYNVLNLYTNIKEDCKCANEFYKYFVYYEGILSISNVFRFVAIFVTLFIVILFNNLR